MKNLLNKVGFDVSTPYLYNDNLSSLFQWSNPLQEKYFKHVDIYYHYVRDLIKNKQIKPYYINRKKNPANILTKNLGQTLFNHFHPSLGLGIL